MGRRVDLVIPAHNEQALIGTCLAAVVADVRDLDARIVVVANGCDDATADIARAVPGVTVLELPVASKPAALNAAGEHLRDCPVVYLDADTVITPGTTRALLAAMTAAGGPVLAGPRPVLVRPADPVTRSFATVWSRLPAVAGDVIGGGCYAVDAEGRRRWGDFPDVVADDAFVRSLFAPDERRVVEDAGFLLVLPSGAELSRVLARWRRGNAELGASASPAAGGGRNARAVLAEPGLWRHIPAFVWVQATSRMRRRRRWARADGVRASGARADAAGLGAAGSPGAAGLGGAGSPGAAGLGAAGLGGAGSPDDLVVIGSGQVDTLRALAARFPEAGLYTGPVTRPALRDAVAYGLGRRPHRRPPPVLLIRRALLERLGGADARFGAHGAVADLCLRARRRGITPMSVLPPPTATPRHKAPHEARAGAARSSGTV
ncbi:glycosyltransferase [Actinoplanes sp. DH11]|uniref:glycosyltransferase n=1 Tax=Actinoplanes sp. DH11 TaxID=2857011 RepID=UPI001E5DF2BA|nr:glycosyltransferase [Actinoplanes sp. DH11]